MTSQMKAAQAESIAHLRELLKPGDTVYTKVNSVSRSGMGRRISLYIGRGSEIVDITWHVARADGEPTKQRGQYVQDAGLHVSGCGMDMCFATVYNLGRVLFPDGFGEKAIKSPFGDSTPEQWRPLTKAKADIAVEAGYQFRGRNGDTSGWDNDGGYALNKRDL